MSYLYTIQLRQRKRWLIVIGLALCAAISLWFGRHTVFSTYTTSEPEALSKGNKDETAIALTFDISWGDEKVHAILKQLKQKHVQATFFVSGEWAERHPKIIKKITDDKHQLGMLGYRYKSYLDQKPEQVKRDLRQAQEVFEKLGYDDIDLVRPPSGQFNKDTIKIADGLGLNVIHWNVNPNDWKNPGTDTISKFVLKHTSNGDILLLHASDSAKQTGDALKTILPKLKDKGFQFVPVTDLLHQAHAKSKPID